MWLVDQSAVDGGNLTGTFAPAKDGTYTLTVTESAWDLLESGTAFEQFVLEA